MSRHVIRPFRCVNKARTTIRDEIRHKGLQIHPYIRVRVFAQNERCTGVHEEHMTSAGADTAVGYDRLYVVGNICRAATVGRNVQRFLEYHEWITMGSMN